MEAAKKLVRQLLYEPKFVAIMHYHATVNKRKVTKKQVRDEGLTLSEEQFNGVSHISLWLNLVSCSSNAKSNFKCYTFMIQMCPGWSFMKKDAWAELVKRWIRADEGFAAVSMTNSSNRGSEGTHSQGNRSDGRYQEFLVYTYGTTYFHFPSS